MPDDAAPGPYSGKALFRLGFNRMKTTDGTVRIIAIVCQNGGLNKIPIAKIITALKIIFDSMIAVLRDSLVYSSLVI
jgi:hypothetical protein